MTDPRSSKLIEYIERHDYTVSNLSGPLVTMHTWDKAEDGQHQASSDCACEPFAEGFEQGTHESAQRGVTWYHEFDPTAVAPVPQEDSK